METVKGFKDFLGESAQKRAFIREIIKQVFEKYNFNETETPIVEYEKFVKGENENDEAISDIFKLKDKGKRKLALRYELTFPLKRITQNQKLPFKRFQIGPVFRDEPVSQNRLRQFTQCDIDIIGSTIKNEAELLSATKDILNALKIPFTIYVNNRKLLNEILDELKIKKKEEVIREIDKLDKLSEKEILKNLKKLKAEKLLEIIKQKEDYFKKYNSYSEILKLKKYCKYYGLQIKFVPFLARGLSYYNGTIFEIKSKIKETICAGGAYMINNNQSCGISLGLERLSAISNIVLKIEKILVVSLNEDEKAIKISKQLRTKGKNVSVFFGKPSKALDYANTYGFQKVLFVGKKEVEKKKFKIKNMKTGKEIVFRV